MRILVTGAAGFIGQSLLLALKNAGYTTLAVSRRDIKTMPNADEIISLDLNTLSLGDRHSFARLPSHVDAVVHLADGLARSFERIKSPLSDDVLMRQVKSTIALSGWAQQNDVKKFIYVSSLKAICGEAADSILTEQSQPKPESNYGRSKRLAEMALEKAVIAEPMQLTILRPPIEHGPSCNGNIKRLLRMADSPWPLPLAGKQGQRSTISTTNFCDAICTVLKAEGSVIGSYLVADDGTLSASEMIQIFRELLGRKKRLFSLPNPVWTMMGRLPYIRKVTRRFSNDLVVSDRLFRERFGWRPLISTKDSLRSMVAASLLRTSRLEASALKSTQLETPKLETR